MALNPRAVGAVADSVRPGAFVIVESGVITLSIKPLTSTHITA